MYGDYIQGLRFIKKSPPFDGGIMWEDAKEYCSVYRPVRDTPVLSSNGEDVWISIHREKGVISSCRNETPLFVGQIPSYDFYPSLGLCGVEDYEINMLMHTVYKDLGGDEVMCPLYPFMSEDEFWEDGINSVTLGLDHRINAEKNKYLEIVEKIKSNSEEDPELSYFIIHVVVSWINLNLNIIENTGE